MRRTLLIGLVVVVLIVSGTAMADKPAKPFEGSFTALDSPAAPTSDCPVHVAGAVEGRASHLGVFSGPTTTCGFNLRVVVSPPFVPGGDPPYLLAEFTNEATWIAANGDELQVEAAGVFVQSLPDGIDGVRGTITAVGGTGRFAGATGEAHGRRDGDNPVTFEGWIDYDASNAFGQ
jgi:hypothetical protein